MTYIVTFAFVIPFEPSEFCAKFCINIIGRITKLTWLTDRQSTFNTEF